MRTRLAILGAGLACLGLAQPAAAAPRSCSPIDNAARVLKSPNPNDVHPDWKGESYVGLSWSLAPAGRAISNETGRYLKGDLISPRGGVINKGVYVIARDWNCGG